MTNKSKGFSVNFLAAILLLFCVASFGQTTTPKATTDSFDYYFNKRKEAVTGLQYPQFSFKTGVDSTFSNENLKDKISFINLWFEACLPCIAELASLNTLYLRYKDNPHFAFISFTFETPEKIVELRKKYHLLYPIISISNEESYRLNQNFGFPVNIILDAKGVIQFLECGGDNNPETVKYFFEHLYYLKVDEQLKAVSIK